MDGGAGKDEFRGLGLHVLLEEALQRPCAEAGIVAVVDDILLRGFGQGDADLLVGKALVGILHQQVHDTADVVLRQGLEHDDLVQTVQELGAEVALQLGIYRDGCLRIDVSFRVDPS